MHSSELDQQHAAYSGALEAAVQKTAVGLHTYNSDGEDADSLIFAIRNPFRSSLANGIGPSNC